MFESHHLQRSNQLYNLSEQFAIECNPDGTACGGGDPARVSEFLLESGIPLASVYPYDYLHAHFGICQSGGRIFAADNTGLAMSQNSSDQELMEYLQKGPLVTLFSIYDINTLKMYSSGSYTGCPTTLSMMDINHALELIGYDENNWIVKNSWGSDWGINGLAFINRKQNCGIGLFNVQLQTCPDGQYIVNPTLPNEYGYMMASKYITCQSCPPNCSKCTSPTKCTACPSGQYLMGGSCVASCPDYLSASGSSCACPLGSYIDGASCKQCSTNCKSCASGSLCTTCLQGFLINVVDGKCYSSCPSNTQLINGQTCTCLNGTYLNGGFCASCLAACKYCTNQYTCVTCLSGFITNAERTICQQCPTNCDKCISPNQCTSCQTGYLLNIFDLLCYTTCPLAYMLVQDATCVCKGNIDATNTRCEIPCGDLCFSCTN